MSLSAERLDAEVKAQIAEEKRIVRSWDEPSGEVIYFRIGNPYALDAKVRAAAELGRDFACAHLGVATPQMLYYAKAGSTVLPESWLFKGSERNGHADRKTKSIGVRVEADCTPWLAAEVAAHEVFHLTQPVSFSKEAGAAREEDALAYGEWAAGVLVPHDGRLVKFHTHRGHPYSGETLAGIAEPGDVVIAKSDGEVSVWWNSRSKDSPQWARHYATCPIDTRLAVAGVL